MQDFMHRLLNLQCKSKDIVRMPDKTWIGFGGEVQYFIDDSSALVNWVLSIILEHRSEFTPYVKKNFFRDKFLFSGEVGIDRFFMMK